MTSPDSAYAIRPAAHADIETLVDFTVREASEAEGVTLDRTEAMRGVRGAFQQPPLARYWVAETADGRIAASASIVTEWSNFHGGFYWWIQSVFIAPEHRGRGLIELLLDHLARMAEAGGALALRLYAHSANHRALHAYQRCGFVEAPYTILTLQSKHGGSS